MVLGFLVVGFRSWGFRGYGFRFDGFGFQVLCFQVYGLWFWGRWVYGFRVYAFGFMVLGLTFLGFHAVEVDITDPRIEHRGGVLGVWVYGFCGFVVYTFRVLGFTVLGLMVVFFFAFEKWFLPSCFPFPIPNPKKHNREKKESPND